MHYFLFTLSLVFLIQDIPTSSMVSPDSVPSSSIEVHSSASECAIEHLKTVYSHDPSVYDDSFYDKLIIDNLDFEFKIPEVPKATETSKLHPVIPAQQVILICFCLRLLLHLSSS